MTRSRMIDVNELVSGLSMARVFLQLIGEDLTQLRAEREISLRKLGEQIGVRYVEIWGLENGRILPNKDDLERLVLWIEDPNWTPEEVADDPPDATALGTEEEEDVRELPEP